MFLYGASLIVLVVYSVVAMVVADPSVMLGWIVSAAVVVLDSVIFIYSLSGFLAFHISFFGLAFSLLSDFPCGCLVHFLSLVYPGRMIHPTVKLILFGGSRLILISFGFDQWFIGFSFVYLLFGVYLSYVTVNVLVPPIKQRPTKTAAMKFTDFLAGERI